ncbi:uncharacterized protein LOC110849411 [Folsomia candida]|uniref:uncharacterized protein LOC110849411 n=1 Tax=Folsomia candida TaxID=158441 RepID=UPI001604B2CC|nr:uncharacterized protein LOC110849411 [Folsomia candida]
MISDSELLRQEPKMGDLFFWRDASDNIQMNVMTEQDITKNLTQIYFSLLLDRHGDMRDMTVNKVTGDVCLVSMAGLVTSNFNSDPLNLDGCKVKELEQQWGWKVVSKRTYSFHIYSDDSWVADQLKSVIRRKFGVLCARDPYSAEVVLAKHTGTIYEHLRKFLPRLPQIREDYFNNPPPPPPDKLENARPPPPMQEERKCELCRVVFTKNHVTPAQHMEICHYSGPNALTCDLCPCSFATSSSLHVHRGNTHVGAEPQKRSVYGIPDFSDEDTGKCDAHFESIPLEEGSKATKYKCTWVGENGQKCGKVNNGLNPTREHACTHLNLKPFTCPATRCPYSSSFYNNVVRHFKGQHEGQQDQDDEESDEQPDEPPKKKKKSQVQPYKRKSC